MKEVKAILQPFKLDEVLRALNRIEGLPGIGVSDVRCMDSQHGMHNPDINVKVELMVPDELVEAVIAAIQKAAHTGNLGDGSIFVIDIDSTIRIRTNERDKS